eukprot:scaffold152340_cov65-Attheya_sp.AAC.1
MERWPRTTRKMPTYLNHISRKYSTMLDQIDETVVLEILIDETLDFPPLKSEVIRAIQKMQNGKAPGENGTPPEAYKAL